MFKYADKGSLTVSMNIIDYENKMLLMLADESSYKLVYSNALDELQKETKIFVQSWNNKQYFYNGVIKTKYHKNKFSQTDTMLCI